MKTYLLQSIIIQYIQINIQLEYNGYNCINADTCSKYIANSTINASLVNDNTKASYCLALTNNAIPPTPCGFVNTATVCIERTCANIRTPPSSDFDCSQWLSSCTISNKVTAICISNTSACTAFTGTASQCQSYSQVSGDNIIKCWSVSGASVTTPVACKVKECSDNKTSTTNEECSSFFPRCKYNGTMGCVLNPSMLCSNYLGNSTTCVNFKSSDGNYCTSGTAKSKACIIRVCSDDGASTKDLECSSFLMGCVTKGVGCIADSEPCTKYLKCKSPQNPNIQYLGQFSMNQPHGFGFAIFGDDTWYFGTWNKSRVHPQDQQGDLSNFGVCCRSNGELYYGNWFERKLQLGYAQTLQYCYYGEFKNGLPEGFGHCQYYDGTIYSGYWRQGLMEGNGILWYQDRNKYIGTFKQSHKSGFGYEKKQNSEYFGYFKNNKNHGLGTKQTQDEISEGIWIQGELEGLYSKQQIKQGPKKWYVKIDGRTEYLNNVEEQRSIIELHGKQQDFESNKNKLDELYNKLIDKTKDIKLKCSEFKEFYYGYLDIMQDWSKLNTLQTWIEQQNQIHI